MATNTAPVSAPLNDGLLAEIQKFEKLCCGRQKFNSAMDIVLNTLGIAVSLGIVACGIWDRSKYAALLGGLMAAIVSAQRAFPFSQRWQFYRILDGQANNLLTETRQGLVTTEHAVAVLKSMRLDFAQQVPRGSNFRSDSTQDTAENSSGEDTAPVKSATAKGA